MAIRRPSVLDGDGAAVDGGGHHGGYTILPDGRRDDRARTRPAREIVLVQHWFEELKRLVRHPCAAIRSRTAAAWNGTGRRRPQAELGGYPGRSLTTSEGLELGFLNPCPSTKGWVTS